MGTDKAECKGCRHITHKTYEYCYMFEHKPERLPCAQHDMYSEQRKANGKRIHDSAMKGELHPIFKEITDSFFGI